MFEAYPLDPKYHWVMLYTNHAHLSHLQHMQRVPARLCCDFLMPSQPSDNKRHQQNNRGGCGNI